MNRVFGLVCTAFLLLSGCVSRQEGPGLWRLTDADSEITLFGTVHMLPPSLKWRTPKIDRAFAGADVVYFETETDEGAQTNIANLIKVLGQNAPGVKLTSLLNEADQRDLTAVCAKLNVDCTYLQGARPWLAGVQLSVAYVAKQGQVSDSGVERVFETEAKQSGKTRRYFETAEQQLNFFANLPQPVEIGFLRSTLKEILQDSDDTDAMNNAWARGDTKKLGAYIDMMMAEAGPELSAALLRDRNQVWAGEIDKMMKGQGKIFIAVGAAHLLGPDGVPAMLRAKGYKVEGP